MDKIIKRIFLTFWIGIMLCGFLFYARNPSLISIISFEVIEENLQNSFWNKNLFFDIYGYINRYLSPNEIIRNDELVVRRSDGRIAIPQTKHEMDYQINAVKDFSDYCKEHELDLLYVNYPAQCGEDKELLKEGIYSYCDFNSTKLKKTMEQENMNLIDLCDILSDELNEIFYRTDHHMTTDGGLKSAKIILDYMNDKFDCEYDSIDFSDFIREQYNDSWLGETGKYVSKTWSGELDDYQVIYPKFCTDFEYKIPWYNMIREGSFEEVFINRDYYDSSEGVYDNRSWHYSYLSDCYGETVIDNKLIEEGKNILYIKDSFSLVVIPFIATNVNCMHVWDMRDVHNVTLKEYIEDNNIDIVIVGYTEGSSINKEKMFYFNE